MIADNKFTEKIASFLECDEDEYIAFSKKFSHSFRNFICKDHRSAHFLFLSGGPGLGKSITLKNEYLAPLKRQNIAVCTFNFIPDRSLHNHFFLKSLIKTLIETVKKKEKEQKNSNATSESLENLYSSFLEDGKSTLYYTGIIKNFWDIVSGLSSQFKIVFIFEDIHLSGKSFADFLKIASTRKILPNINIICTTRSSKTVHGFDILGAQRWLYFRNLSMKEISKFVHSLKERPDSFSTLNDHLLNLSQGSPFYLKELYLLNMQKGGHLQSFEKIGRDIINISGITRGSNNASTITGIRLSYLEESARNVLKILNVIGFDCNYEEFVFVLEKLGLDVDDGLLLTLRDQNFLKIERSQISFSHHLAYESIKFLLTTEENERLSRQLFYIYLKNKNMHDRTEKLANYAFAAGLNGFACYFSECFADSLYKNGQFELASVYYERHINLLDTCSSPEKIKKRVVASLIKTHDSYLILGKNDKAREIALSLSNIAEELSILERSEIYSLLTRSYWTLGQFTEAGQYARINIELSQTLEDKSHRISSLVRYGSICSELGEFRKTIEIHNKALNEIDAHEHDRKFGLFVNAYSNVTSVQSICYAELGNYLKTQEAVDTSLQSFEKTDDLFSKLFIITHASYALVLMGKFSQALKYLEQGSLIFSETKASLLGPECISLLGICKLYNGQMEEGLEKIELSQSLLKNTFQGHKKGMIDLIYLESLLISFHTEKFSQIIDLKIEECKRTGQLSFVAWMYFTKAVYHAFYKRSTKGFVGSLAKANMIARNLEMGTLIENVKSLSMLDNSGVLALTENCVSHNALFLDKARFFCELTRNIKPINFHRKL